MTPKKLAASIIRKLQYWHMLDCLSDTLYLKAVYWMKTGKKLNLNHPVSFNEKLQWLKIYDRKDIYTTMVDKYEVKKYVAEILGDRYIVPTLGVWDKFDDIDFNGLPEKFVLKCTHDSGGLVVCRDKNKLDFDVVRKKLETSLENNYYIYGREWPYKNVKPRIIAEQFLDDGHGSGLFDYKFYCFNGEPRYLYVSTGLENHETAQISFLTLDWTFAEFRRSDFKPFEQLPEKPSKFDEMIKVARELSSGTKFLRVDLYEVNGNVYFSELTFSPCSGMMPFSDEKYNIMLGNMIDL